MSNSSISHYFYKHNQPGCWYILVVVCCYYFFKMTGESQVSMFYASKNIFVTGGTGFMGKVLIWKLLYSCSKLNTIYVLMRSKHGKSAMSRKAEFFSSSMFDYFKENNPNILEKVIFIFGDVGEEGLALSEKDRNLLINEVSIVFHSAAILRMNSDLRTAINMNTVGTIRMLNIALQMKKLEAFVYISTAYCCCDNDIVEERLYPSKHNPYDIINLARWMDPEILEKITPKLIYPLPNTYIYSKRITENVLTDYQSRVPIIVARPSIVGASFREPLRGWCDTMNGPTGFIVGGGTGVIRTTRINMEARTESIPVDMVINSILILPWANSRERLLDEIGVYNITQNAYEDMTWLKLMNHFIVSNEKYPLNKMLWYPNYGLIRGDGIVIYTIKWIFLHYLPAYVIDFILLLIGQKPFLVRVHDKITLAEKLLGYFTRREWIFVHDKLLKLEQVLNAEDEKLFIINMKNISDLQDYVDDMVIGFKTRMFNEDLKTLNRTKIKLKILCVVDKIAIVFRYFLLWKILIFAFDIISSIFN